jgi:hypothetical protein
MLVVEEFIYYAPSVGGLCHGAVEEAVKKAATSDTRARRGRRKGQEEDRRPRQAGGAMEREEGRRPRSGVVDIYAGRWVLGCHGECRGSTMEHNCGAVVIFFEKLCGWRVFWRNKWMNG